MYIHFNVKKYIFKIQTAFVVDEVTNIIKEAVEGAIGGNGYQHNKVNQWTSNVVEQCLNQLTKLGKPFKYIGKKLDLNYSLITVAGFITLFNLLSLLYSYLCDNAEKWCWTSYCKHLFLGQFY